MMGIFSIYTGLIYNDVFSKSLKIFNSGWSINYSEADVMSNHDLMLDPRTDDYAGVPYPFGIDPVWQVTNHFAYLSCVFHLFTTLRTKLLKGQKTISFP